MENVFNEIHEKLDIISSRGIDVLELKRNIDLIEDNYNNQINTNSVTTAQLRQIKSSNYEISSLKSLIDEINNSSKIFDDINKIMSNLSNEMTSTKIDKIVSILSSEILEYKSLKDKGYSSSNELSLCKNIYTVIKYEYRVKCSSSLLDRIIKMNFNIPVFLKLIEEDITKYINNTDIKKRFNEEFLLDEIDKKMVYLLAFNEDDYKDKKLQELKEERNKVLDAQDRYRKYEEIKKEKPKNESYDKGHIKKSIKRLSRLIIPKILSFALLTTINANVVNVYKETSTKYSTRMNSYDEINGYYSETVYDDLDTDEVQLTIYEETNRSDKMTKTIYRTQKQDDLDISEYATSVDTSTLEEISSETVVTDKFSDGFIKVQTVDSIDYNDSKVEGVYVGIMLITSMYILLDMLFGLFMSYMSGIKGDGLIMEIFLEYKEVMNSIKDDLTIIRECLEDLKIKESGNKFSKEKYKELYNEYNKLLTKYNNMLIKNKELEDLINYNDYSLTLK